MMPENADMTQQIYTEVVGMRAEMRQLITDLAVIKARNHSADILHADHETRLRAAESAVARIGASLATKVITSVVAACIAAASAALTTVAEHIH